MSVSMQPNPDYTLSLNRSELSEYVKEVFPQAETYQWKVEQLVPGSIAVSMEIEERHLRPGGTVSGPTMFALADVAAYLVILGHIGKVALAVTTSLNINFLSRPPQGNLMARCSLIKLGKRLAICELHITGVEDEHIVAQATVTYSIPPTSQ
jgi:uncharacterized protein (TIGR00369 family)